MKFSIGLGLALVVGLTSCHSSHIQVTVENRTGAPIRLLEVDYPSASFGSDSLDSGASYHYRIQVQGSGPLKVQYTAGAGGQRQGQRQAEGPVLAERQEGAVDIILLPDGKAEFHPHLSGDR
jgi:hypothetical protein